MTARASAFCPGHITAFFEICDSAAEPLKRGSRGAGLCISLGARSTVSVQEASWQQITVRIDGKESDAPVTKESLASIIGEGKLNIEVDTVLELPMEQGFAMSAAGALSATYALCDAMKIDQRRAFRAVHIAEVNNRTGLGDVAGIYAGGMEIRLEPGMPPNGVVESIDAVSEIVLSVLGPSIRTAGVLADPEKSKLISLAGKRCVNEFNEHRTLEHLLALGMEFVEEAGLMTKETLNGVMAAEKHGMAGMTMLGNSIFCVGDMDKLIEALKPLGQTYRCEIDHKGPRII